AYFNFHFATHNAHAARRRSNGRCNLGRSKSLIGHRLYHHNICLSEDLGRFHFTLPSFFLRSCFYPVCVSQILVSSLCKQATDITEAVAARDVLDEDSYALIRWRCGLRFTNWSALRAKRGEMNGMNFDHAISRNIFDCAAATKLMMFRYMPRRVTRRYGS